jgi:NAD-dependent SIR2 family protein deacetylase
MTDLARGRFQNIIVLTGAGISQASGIPCFRTKGGIYDQTALHQENRSETTPSSETMISFTPESFRDHPREFYAYIRRVFLHKQPTRTHRFIASLHRRGWLRRWYTQNIDGLEHQVGVPAHLIVEAHGKLLEGRCTACGTLPFSSKNEQLQQAYLTQLLHSDEVPVCPSCSMALRPAVSFFGEAMGERFTQLRPIDFRACDLLLVIGTSLTVYPFAALVSDVEPSVPRILINHDPVGPWSSDPRSFRDLFLAGDCDEVVKLLEEPESVAEQPETGMMAASS